MTMTETMLKAFKASGMSIRQLSLKADAPYSATHRFIVSSGGITLETAEKFADVLGLSLQPTKAKKRKA